MSSRFTIVTVLVFTASLLFTAEAFSASRIRASGTHHTVSHGGHYVGGKGSSHKGGHYRSVKTGNKYRIHKK